MMNRRRFIGTCACCAFASMGATLLHNTLSDNDDTMNHLEIHLAEHCNLNCKYCSNFSCIAQEEFYNLDKFNQDIQRMSHILNKRLNELILGGGEPLLNPQINEYVKISRKYFPDTRIDIITNATLLDSMDEGFWKTLNENDTSILPSIYPIKINWTSIINKAKKYNVKIYARYLNKTELTLDNISEVCTNYFTKHSFKESGYNNGLDTLNCPARYKCNCLYEGKLYACFAVAYIKHLNKKFNTNFVVTEDDYLDIYKVKNTKDINKFLKTAMIPFCKYCAPPPALEVKWENSKEHDVSEWT